MKFKTLILAILIVSIATPALAQSGAAPTQVTYGGFGFAFDPKLAPNLDIRQIPGDPKDLEAPGGPEVKHLEVILYSGDTVPAPFDSLAGIRVYKTADFTGYKEHETRLKALQTLLKDRPDLAGYMKPGGRLEESLPFLPVLPAAQIVRARAQYVETTSVKGITFVTAFAQGISPFTSSDFMVTFQGISTDGSTYISAVFRPTTGLYPKEIPADFNMDQFVKDLSAYQIDSIAKLNKAKPEDFNPSLATLEAVMRSFAVAAAS